MNAFDAYRCYLSLKKHFSDEKYDYFLYNGKTKSSSDSFNNRKDRYFFEKVSKHYDCFGYLLANIKKNPDYWIGNVFDDESDENFFSWKKNIDSLTYVLNRELNSIEKFKECFLVEEGQYPDLLRLNNSGSISDETICLTNRIINFLPKWDKKIKDTYLYPKISLRYRKYDPFITYDKDKLTELITQIARNKTNGI